MHSPQYESIIFQFVLTNSLVPFVNIMSDYLKLDISIIDRDKKTLDNSPRVCETDIISIM